MRISLLLLPTLALVSTGCDFFVGARPRYGDTVEVAEAKAAFECGSPSTPTAERACKALEEFEDGAKVSSFPSEGETVYLSRLDCSRPRKNVVLHLTALLSEPSPGEFEETFRAPGSLSSTVMVSVMASESADETAILVLAALADGKPTPGLSDDQSSSIFPNTWDEWRDTWTRRDPKPIPTAQSGGTSLIERPSELTSALAYWREVDGSLIRVQPPYTDDGWCVSRYHPLP